jgi:hypothetical protein
VKQWWISKGLLFMLLFVGIAALWSYRTVLARRAYSREETSEKPGAPPQQLSAEGQATLRAIIQAGNLADLRWPNFTDYDGHVKKFYELQGYALSWVRGMEPTGPAQQVISVLLKAEEKGLAAGDGYGALLPERPLAVRAQESGAPSKLSRAPTGVNDALPER